jgi:hypothetical protein
LLVDRCSDRGTAQALKMPADKPSDDVFTDIVAVSRLAG